MMHLSGSGRALTSPRHTDWPFCPRRLSLPAFRRPASQKEGLLPGGSSEKSAAPGWWDSRWTGRRLHQVRPVGSTHFILATELLGKQRWVPGILTLQTSRTVRRYRHPSLDSNSTGHTGPEVAVHW